MTDEYEALLRRACEMRGPGLLPIELVDAPEPAEPEEPVASASGTP